MILKVPLRIKSNPQGGQISKQNHFMSGAAVTQKLSQNQKSKIKQLKVPHLLKNNRFFKILIFKINQTEIKNNQNIWWSAILCFGKPLETIVASFISKWINYSKKIVLSDLKGFLQGI